jgi:hypothetical protein
MSFETYLLGDSEQLNSLGIKVISSLDIDKDDNLFIYSTNNYVTLANGCNENVYKISDFYSIPDDIYPYIDSNQYEISSVTYTPASGQSIGDAGYHAGMIGNGICVTDDTQGSIHTMFITLANATGEANLARTAIINEPKFVETSLAGANYYILPAVPQGDGDNYMNCLGNMISLPNSINNTRMLLYMVPEFGVFSSIPHSSPLQNSVASESSQLIISTDKLNNQYPISIASDIHGNIYVGTTNITHGPNVNPRTVVQQSIKSYSLSPQPIDPTAVPITATLIYTFENPPLSVVESSIGNWTSITVTHDGIVYALYEVPQDDTSSLIKGYILQYTTDGKYVQLIKTLPVVQPFQVYSSSYGISPAIPITLPSFTLPTSSLATDSKGRLYFTESYKYDIDFPHNSLVRYTPPSDSNICFPGKTPIVTDMGIVNIEDIDVDYHTIRDKKIVALTKTKSQDNYLVCFETNSLEENYPSDKTIMSSEHKVLYKDNLVQAKKLVGRHKGVKRVKYNGQTLYNILLEDYSWVMVNDMVCETLHPENELAKWYLSDLPQSYKDKIITVMNYASSKKDYTSYKKAVSCLDF